MWRATTGVQYGSCNFSVRAAAFDARVEMEWTDRAGRLGAFETATEGHVIANASADRPADFSAAFAYARGLSPSAFRAHFAL